MRWSTFLSFVIWNLTVCLVSSFSSQHDGPSLCLTPITNGVMVQNPSLFGSTIGDIAQSLTVAWITILLHGLAIIYIYIVYTIYCIHCILYTSYTLMQQCTLIPYLVFFFLLFCCWYRI